MYQLIIGNKNYSSWSLRPWLTMKVAGIEFEEISIELHSENGKQEILQYSPAGKVPILIADDLSIWDSMAIVEHLAERHPEKALWPFARDSRSIARAVTCEMHSSFTELRNTIPMNCRKLDSRKEGKPVNISHTLQKDIDRISQIWKNCREEYGEQGDFLFGQFSIADAFYAPVAIRLHSQGIPMGEVEQNYIDHILSLPAMKEWIEKGQQETTIIEANEVDLQS